MSLNKVVIVLAPNGRKQTVKVTPNSTILHILEEVCKKQGFKPEEYDLRHHNHILDMTATMRFSGLPNNAQLEMATVVKAREESSVMLSLQLESGDRVTGNFMPRETLWDVIQMLSPEGADPDSNPVIIYMRREVSGQQALQETMLRNLGLTCGRAMMRFLHGTPEQLHRQANVSAPLQQRPSAVPEQFRRVSTVSVPSQQKAVLADAPPEHPVGPPGLSSSSKQLNETADEQPEPMEVEEPVVVSNAATCEPHSNVTVDGASVHRTACVPATGAAASTSAEEPMPPEEEIVLLGERNAIVFSQAMAQSVPYEDLPEDFYDLTVEDASALYRHVKAARAQMDDAPLATSAVRQLEDSKRILNQLGSYKRAVLRIRFPDQIVLQGTFTPIETIAVVKEFVQRYLQNPDVKFHLFTTPPKVILSPSTRLVEANCVPSAMLHFGLDVDQSEDRYLREELLTRLTSPTAAGLAACQSRGIKPGFRPSCTAPAESGSTANPTSSASIRGPSTSGRRQPPRQENEPLTKVPKWFKPAK